jgi:hypothetical protein
MGYELPIAATLKALGGKAAFSAVMLALGHPNVDFSQVFHHTDLSHDHAFGADDDHPRAEHASWRGHGDGDNGDPGRHEGDVDGSNPYTCKGQVETCNGEIETKVTEVDSQYASLSDADKGDCSDDVHDLDDRAASVEGMGTHVQQLAQTVIDERREMRGLEGHLRDLRMGHLLDMTQDQIDAEIRRVQGEIDALQAQMDEDQTNLVADAEEYRKAYAQLIADADSELHRLRGRSLNS